MLKCLWTIKKLELEFYDIKITHSWSSETQDACGISSLFCLGLKPCHKSLAADHRSNRAHSTEDVFMAGLEVLHHIHSRFRGQAAFRLPHPNIHRVGRHARMESLGFCCCLLVCLLVQEDMRNSLWTSNDFQLEPPWCISLLFVWDCILDSQYSYGIMWCDLRNAFLGVLFFTVFWSLISIS